MFGAALVYCLDPQSGARRRAEIRQRSAHYAREIAYAARGWIRDLALRSRGLVAELQGSLAEARARTRGEHVDDRVLTDRVRAKLGRLSSNAGLIEVQIHAGRVELRGSLLRSEITRVLRGIAKVRGVREIVGDDLEVLESADRAPQMPDGRPS